MRKPELPDAQDGPQERRGGRRVAGTGRRGRSNDGCSPVSSWICLVARSKNDDMINNYFWPMAMVVIIQERGSLRLSKVPWLINKYLIGFPTGFLRPK